jgi:3-dehydroquinate dehydratase
MSHKDRPPIDLSPMSRAHFSTQPRHDRHKREVVIAAHKDKVTPPSSEPSQRLHDRQDFGLWRVTKSPARMKNITEHPQLIRLQPIEPGQKFELLCILKPGTVHI